MKKVIVIASILVAIIALIVFNKIISRKDVLSDYAEVKKGTFEITVANSGELLAENSLDIKAPEFGQNEEDNNRGNDRRGGPGRQGGRGQQGGQSRGIDIHRMDFEILDIVPEGTVVQEGDYIAQLNKTQYDNLLKDELENIETLKSDLTMAILDTTATLTALRDEIKNQTYQVEEAEINLEQSQFEPPATIRKAQSNLDKAQRALEQKIKSYTLRARQARRKIEREKLDLADRIVLVNDLQEFLAKFTITAPSPGMVIYKKNPLGVKRKVGSRINAFDRVIATLPDLSSMISKIYVSEIEVSKVKIGQKVNITVDAFPEKAFTGSVISVANIGEKLPNSDAKMFEVQIKLDGSDPELRPAMTTWNKIIIKSIDDAIYIPLECVHTGSDSIPYVYNKNKTRQIVVLGELNDKSVIVKKGLEPGTTIYAITPEESWKFRLVGENLVANIKEGQ
jgi:HlyD family secretion protein